MFEFDIHKMVNLTQRKDRDVLGEKALWQSVLMQAALDAISSPKTKKEKVERAKTISWFSMGNHDYLAVCSLADLEPEFIIKGVRKAVAKIRFKEKIILEKEKRRSAKKNPTKPTTADISRIYL
jgi:hypothetical protein